MKNREKYRDRITKITNNSTHNFCKNFVSPIILKSYGEKCPDISCIRCQLIQHIWLEEEYKEPEEPEVDWSNIKVDTPILVRDSKDEEWNKAYFSRYEDKIVYAFIGGKTKWASNNQDMYWMYVKLAEEEEEEEENE